MSLEDVIKRKLEEQKKTELVLKKLDAQKNAEQPTQNKDGEKWYEGYFQAGDALKNGYDKGDISKTVVGTGADVYTNLVKGVVGWGESAVDAGAAALGNIAANFGNQEFATKMGEFAKKDLYDEEAVARQIIKIAPLLNIGNPGAYLAAHMANAAVRLDDWLSMKEEDDGAGGKITVKKDNSILGEKTGGLISSTGEMFVKQAANLTGVPIGSLITAVTAYGSQAEQALKEGATAQQAHWSAAISAGAEIIFEKLSGGIKLGGVPMDEALRKQISNSIAPVAIKNMLNLGLDIGGEAGEEVLTEFFSKLGTALYKKEDLADILFSPQALNDYINAAIGGGLMGGAFNVPNAVVGTATGRDYKTGRNENEQTVIDKVYKDRVAEQEKGGKKLTTKEKGQILDAVEQAYERGEIAVEDIEAALGGETYRKYTEATKQQEAMQAEFDQLNGMKKSDMTGAQEDRLQELRQQLETMKTEDAAGKLQLQYQQEARAKAGGGQLMESYNQREQRRQAFQADVESYDAKQRAIVQKAIDSGILNNTRKSHEFVDLVAKIGAETGTDFDFTNSKKLRESGFALEGVTVNGFTDGKTVTVNINSAKALNTVVGHEIMHVLEGTELAGKLQEQLFAYAKTKGEFDKRRADLETLYAGRDADIDRELAADLVGDYLFTDIDFVRNLKAGDRNLFQRVFDEIKHLVKLATAGSKEARELEKVKKLFEDVYREAGTEKSTAKDGGVEYSISKDVNGNSFVDVTEDIFDANNGESIARVIQKVIAEKFHNIIDVHGQKIQINKTTNDEFRRSNSANELMSSNPQAYNDKLKTIANADEILRTARNWIGEEKKHNRKDDIVEFARGNVAYRVGLNGYIADVIVGTRKNGSAVLYDLVNIYEKEITEAPVTVASKDNSQRRQDASAEEIITQPNATVKQQFSLSAEADRAYMDAVENANIEAAQVMVDEAAKQAGFTEEVYHGTRRGFGFTKYDPNKSNVESAFFTSGDLAVARTYSQDDGVTNISLAQELGLTAGNYRFFANTEGMIEIDAKGGVWDAIRLDQELQDKLNSGAGSNPYDRINPVTSTNELAGYAKKSGYRVVKITNVYDQSMQPGQEYHQEKPGSVYIFLYPNEQLRSADPVTYDDEGNVIPLSQRFNPQSGDFRESLSRAGETAGFDDSQIYGRDVALEGPEQTKPVAAQPETKAPGMEAPTAAEMPKAQAVEAPVAEEKPVQTAQEKAKAAPAMEAPTAAEMPGEKPVEAPVAEEAKEGAVKEAETEEPEKPKTYTLAELLQQEEENLQTQVQELEQKHREDMARLDQRIKDLRAAESRRGQKAEIRWNQLENRIASFKNEIEENRNAMQEVAEEYDKIIAEKQNEIQKKKRKESGAVQSLKRSIAHQKKLKANAVAKYRAKIETLEVRMAEAKEDLASAMRDSDSGKTLSRINAVYGQKKAAEERFKKKIERLQEKITANRERMRNVTAGQDAYVRKEQQIQRRLEADKITLRETFDQRIAKIREKTASEEEFTAEKARELYEAVRDHKKGDHWPAEIKEMLDWGYSYQQIKSALLMVENKPGAKADPNVPHEKTAREIIARAYDDAVYKILELETDYGVQERNLEDAAKAELEKFKKNYRGKESRMKYAIEAARLIGNIKGWKDKKTGWSYQINTLGRNLREVVRDEEGNPDTETADAITDYLEGNYDRNEAELNKEANQIKEAYRQMNMTEEENVYVQMLGEYRSEDNNGEKIYVTKDEVESFYEAHKDQIDTEKVETILEMARKMYDDLFERENEIRRQHGMEELKYIKGYFPHWQETQQKVWQKILNIKPGMEEKQPTRIAGTTGYHRPNVQSRFFQKERRGPLTEFNFMKGLDMYVDGALDQIYHIPDIQRRKAVENHLRLVAVKEGDPEGAEQLQKKLEAIQDSDVYNADEAQAEIDKLFEKQPNDLSNLVQDLRKGTDMLTGKKTIEDQAAEIAANKTIMQDMAQLSSRVSANQIVGSISSAASNVIPIVQNMAVVGPAQTGKAMLEAMRSIGKDDSVVEKSTFLTNRLRQNEKLYKEFWDKASDVLSKPMTVMDSIASETVWRSKYMQNLERGMTEAEAIQDADRYAKGLMASRSRGNMPTIFASKNPLLRGFTQYQLEQINQYMFAAKDIPLEVKNEGKVALPMAYAKLLIGSHLLNGLLQMITGREMVTDPIGILGEIGKDIFREIGDDDEEEPLEEAGKVTVNALKELAQELPFIGSALGGGRFPIASAMPYGGAWEMVTGAVEDVTQGDLTNLFKEFMSAIFYGAMPMGGGQLKKTLEGAGMWLEMDDEFPFVKPRKTTGSYTAKGDLRFKVEANPWTVFKSLIFGQYSSQAAREYFDEGRKPLSEGQLEEFQSVDMSMSEYWDYRDALKAAGDKTADKMEVVMGLDLPMEQKNILANNIVNRKDPIDLTGAEDFGSFAEFDFFNQHRKKYDFLKGSGVPIAQYLTMEAANNALKEYEPGSEEMQKFLKDNNLTLEKCQALQREKQTLDFRYNSGEKKYAFLINNGISVQEFEAMSQEEKDEVNMLYENPKKLEFLRGKGITAAQYKDLDKVTKEDLDYQYKNPEKYSFLQKNGISVADYSGFDKATKDAWDTMAKNPKKYEFLKKQGVTVDQYKLFNQGWKDAWNWAYDNQDAYLVSQGVTEDLYTYRRYVDKIKGISGDKNEKGNTISGSKRKKIWAYIQTLPLSDGAKRLLFKQMDPDDDTYDTEVVRYVQSLGMTYAEKKRILEKLGFKIDANGKITK